MKRMSLLPVLATLLLLPLCGCSSAVSKPRLCGPGPAGYQRYNATQYDPFPSTDMGPEIVGGRPIDYMNPPAEVPRARQQLPNGPWR